MNKRPTLITQTIAGIKSNYCLSLKIISKNSRQISTSITQLYTCVEIYFKSPKRNQEMYFITLQYYQASVKFSRPLVSSFQCRCLSLDHLSPDFSIIQHSSRGSQAIYPLAVRAPVQHFIIMELHSARQISHLESNSSGASSA